MNEDWMDEAICRGMPTEVFFSEGRGYMTKDWKDRVKRICRECPVRVDCLEYALVNYIGEGVYGGLMPAERQKVAKLRRIRGGLRGNGGVPGGLDPEHPA